MKVKISDLGIELEVKTKGTTFSVHKPNGKDFQGSLQVTKSGLTWYKGKKQTGNNVNWNEFIKWIESQE